MPFTTASNRLIRKLGHHKGTKFTEFPREPLDNEGYDGDIGAYKTSGGVMFCVKAFSQWWPIPSLSATPEAPVWHIATLESSWVDFTSTVTCRYTKDSLGIVRFRGLIKDGDMASSVIFRLPPAYRPSVTVYFPCLARTLGSDMSVNQVWISKNGAVGVNEGEHGGNYYMSLSNISYYAGGQ